MFDVTGVDMNKDIKLCPVPYGGMVLFNNMIPHRRCISFFLKENKIPNNSDLCRFLACM